MKRFAVLVFSLAFVVASVPGSSRAALQLTNGCDPTTAKTVETLKQRALDELQVLKDDIANDPSLGILSDAFVTLSAAIENLKASLDRIRGTDPCTVSADEAEALFDALDTEEFGIELIMDLRSEEFIPDGPFVDRAEAAVRTTLEGDEALVVAMLTRLPEQLPQDPSGSDSDALDTDAALADTQAAQDQCALLPPDPLTCAPNDKRCDGTCDDVPGAYADIIEFIIEFI